MSFALYADGRIFPRFDYEARPVFGEASADVIEAKLTSIERPDPHDGSRPGWPFRSITEPSRGCKARGCRVKGLVAILRNV